jgi:hypothetical protein
VDLVAIDAANSVRRVYTAGPVLRAFVLRVAAQANSIRLRRGALLEQNDFRSVPSAIDMKAAVAMALFALDALLRVIGMLEVFGHIRMTGSASLRSDRLGSGHLRVSCKGSRLPGRLLGR